VPAEVLPAIIAIEGSGGPARGMSIEKLWEVVKKLAKEHGIFLYSDRLAFEEDVAILPELFEGIEVEGGAVKVANAEEVCEALLHKAELARRCLSGDDDACAQMGLADPRVNSLVRTLIDIFEALQGFEKCRTREKPVSVAK